MTTGQVSASATKVAGAHVVKFGGAWYKTWMYTNWNGNSDNFSNEGTWNAACQFAAAGNAAGRGSMPRRLAGRQQPQPIAGGDPLASMFLSLPIGANGTSETAAFSLRMTNLDTVCAGLLETSRKLDVQLRSALGLQLSGNGKIRPTANL